MRYEKLLKRLEKECAAYCQGEPVLIDDIYKALEEYSKQGVFNFVNKAIDKGDLLKIERGVYKADSKNVITGEEIAERKYVRSNGQIYGIYGLLYLEVNFGISTQVPNTIDVISNNASRKYRELFIKKRKVILRKSRCTITNDNYCEYMLMELFNNYDIRKYNDYVKRNILEFIRVNKLKKANIAKLVSYFPSKASKNFYLSGVENAFI